MTETTASIAVIGLGAMGYGMAQSALRGGFAVHGADIDEARVAALRAEGGAETPPQGAAAQLSAVLVVVLNAAQTEAVLFGPDGLVPLLSPGAVVLGCATVPPDFARAMADRCAEHGVHYLDAPISGGAAKAATGALSVMASGAPEAFAAAGPVLQAISQTVFALGDRVGAASAMKAVNQLLAGVHIAAMGEAMAFALSQGIPPATVMQVIPSCAGTSWMLENRGPHVVDGDYTPRSRIDIWPKDLGIVTAIAAQAGTPVPVTEAALAQFRAAAEAGMGGLDDAAVTKVYTRAAGLTLPGQDA